MKKNRFFLLFLALCMLAALFSGCVKPDETPQVADAPAVAAPETPEEPAIEEDHDDDSTTVILDEEEIVEDAAVIDEGEAVSCVYPSVEALVEAVETELKAHWKNQTALDNRLTGIETVYVPAEDYAGFRLHSVEVNPYNIFLYYIPEDSETGMITGSEDIIVTNARERETTLDLVCAQQGISPDGDGFAYSEKTGTLYFELDGTVISISAPEGRNDHDSLYALCEFVRVDIDRSSVGSTWEWDFDKYGDDAPQIALLGEENYRAYEKAIAALGQDSRGAATKYCIDLTELGDHAGWTETDRVRLEDGGYRMDIARLRSFCYDDGLPTLAEKVASQYARFKDGDKGVLGPGSGPDDPQDDAELIYDLTGLTVFHPAIPGAKLHVTVNGTDCGDFALNGDSGCTLIPLELPEFVADKPVRVEMRLVDAPEDTEIEVYAGLSSNISRSN